jgi:uncharacterized repeat protein (TIGR03843 family)
MTAQSEPGRPSGGDCPTDDRRVREILTTGELELLGRMPWSSNATFLVEGCLDDTRTRAIYKPRRGEQPLWDFPNGLYQREVASYELSQALGWDLVPLTISRDDGPLGIGSLQRFVDADFAQHYFTLLDDERHHEAFRRLCAFDIVSNNTDRKSGHVLIDRDGHIWAIDNGLSFHAEFKLRTVIWDFAGEEIPLAVLADVQRFVDDGLPAALALLLDPFERDATLTRARALLSERHFPVDTTGRRHPWPLV